MKTSFNNISRNDKCPCGSGLKYKKCCMQKVTDSADNQSRLPISEIFSLLKISLQNLNIVNSEIENIKVKKIDLLNNNDLECQFYAKSRNSIDLKVEISSIMGAIYGFLKDDVNDISINNYAIRAFDENDIELMYVITPVDSAYLVGQGKPIEWMKRSIFNENTADYRLGIAKRQISEIENALRLIIIDRIKI